MAVGDLMKSMDRHRYQTKAHWLWVTEHGGVLHWQCGLGPVLHIQRLLGRTNQHGPENSVFAGRTISGKNKSGSEQIVFAL